MKFDCLLGLTLVALTAKGREIDIPRGAKKRHVSGFIIMHVTWNSGVTISFTQHSSNNKKKKIDRTTEE